MELMWISWSLSPHTEMYVEECGEPIKIGCIINV